MAAADSTASPCKPVKKGRNKPANGLQASRCRSCRFCSGKWDFPPQKVVPPHPHTPPGTTKRSRGFRQSGTGMQAPPCCHSCRFCSGKWDFPPQKVVPPRPYTPPGTTKRSRDFRQAGTGLQASRCRSCRFCSGKWDFPPQKVVPPHPCRRVRPSAREIFDRLIWPRHARTGKEGELRV